jgi:hypothetical protein
MTEAEVIVKAYYPNARIISESSFSCPNGYVAITGAPEHTYCGYYVARTEDGAWESAKQYLELKMIRKLEDR